VTGPARRDAAIAHAGPRVTNTSPLQCEAPRRRLREPEENGKDRRHRPRYASEKGRATKIASHPPHLHVAPVDVFGPVELTEPKPQDVLDVGIGLARRRHRSAFEARAVRPCPRSDYLVFRGGAALFG
jgi:hypothetical protein